jgi:hypothetical protein
MNNKSPEYLSIVGGVTVDAVNKSPLVFEKLVPETIAALSSD